MFALRWRGPRFIEDLDEQFRSTIDSDPIETQTETHPEDGVKEREIEALKRRQSIAKDAQLSRAAEVRRRDKEQFLQRIRGEL